jgi:predicted O-methyltransferase YrrM
MYPGQVDITWGNSNNTLAAITDERPDVIFVDGGHSQHVAEIDIRLSLELVKPGGFIAIDDWNYPTVRAAAYENLPAEQWVIHGRPPVPQIAYYQKRIP